jgi:ubiquinone/menaquinone biosynthesis C-methylase UbiE
MLYEDQAAGFDERVGLSPEICESIARGLEELVRLEAGTMLLEIGAGTGALSIPLLLRPIGYIGFDRSPAMLSVFREKLMDRGLRGEILVADGNERWPVDDGSIDVIFSARALHHVDADHAIAETRRVLRPAGGWLVVGRVRRPNDSIKSILRRRMRRLLEEQGYQGRSHESHTEKVFSALEELGGRRAPELVAARWTIPHRPSDSFTSWEGKNGLVGLDIPAQVKADVLANLRAWAKEEYGDLDQPHEQEEFFELDAIDMRIG